MTPELKSLERIVFEYSKLLGDNLVGIYLHGSLAMDCYNPNSSDVDFLVVVKDDLSFELKRELVAVLLDLSLEGPTKDFEMSVILESDALDITYPTPFILHFSNYHKDKYINDNQYVCGNGVDEDLVAHITIINHRGRCLVGKEIHKVFGNVPKQFYIQSIVNDIEFAKNQIVDMPVYIILNLCRVLYYLQEGAICSKKEGGEWGVKTLPTQFRDLVKTSLKVYEGSIETREWDRLMLDEYTDYMQMEIKNRLN
ncbi:MAG: aminoglycoside adenylyltransferase domain-containing protein [Anaerobacillus sp.]|uniref:aminoglycoside adenylyltransferase domain-containing protein n=1 Tax=Anaerobacillus sp. TaxID=1872506 RepID=UPI0039193C89